MTSIFGFWTMGIGPHAREFPTISRDAWRAFDPHFTVFDDTAALKALSQWSTEVRDLYLDIRIPACRSDIARLALLNAFGGTYVDAHTVPGDPCSLRDYLEATALHDLVIPQIDPDVPSMPFDRIFNSPLSGKAGAPVLTDLLRRSLANLFHQRSLERERGSIDRNYSIFDLTGPNMIRDKIVDYSRDPVTLFGPYRSTIRLVSFGRLEAEPFQLYRHREYRQEGNHWTIREKFEPLFFSSPALRRAPRRSSAAERRSLSAFGPTAARRTMAVKAKPDASGRERHDR